MNYKLYVVGIGSGSYGGMTIDAIETLKKSEVIVGYTTYTKLVRPYFPDKEYLDTPMLKEIERCTIALKSAASGKITAMICSGDPGVYGMASLILELAGEYDVEIEVIPGVTAASGGAALLGAPIGHDFAVISLSDRLTLPEVIEKRIEAAAQADLCIVLYNPASRQRQDYLRRACEIILRYRTPLTVCGVVKNVGREGESFRIMTLSELSGYQADMTTTVYIGNSSTKTEHGRMVTPRGYRHGRKKSEQNED